MANQLKWQDFDNAEQYASALVPLNPGLSQGNALAQYYIDKKADEDKGPKRGESFADANLRNETAPAPVSLLDQIVPPASPESAPMVDAVQSSSAMPAPSLAPKKLSALAPSADPAAPPSPAPQMNPQVKDYLMKKYFSDKYTDEARQKVVDQNKEESSGPNWSAGLAALGAGLSGGNASAAGEAVKGRQTAERQGRLAEFDQGRKRELETYERDQMLAKNSRDQDPSSPESKVFQETLKGMGYKGDVSKLSAERIRELSPAVSKLAEMKMKQSESAREQSNKDREFGLNVMKAKGEVGKKSAEDKKYASYVTEGLRGIQGMRNALKSGQNTFSLIGDNDFTRSLRQMAENYGRMQSGGAINKDEEARFQAMAPGKLDTAEQKAKKLAQMEQMFRERAEIYGVDLNKAGINSSPSQVAQGETVKMKAPDGKVRVVPKNQVKQALAAGGQLLEGDYAGI